MVASNTDTKVKKADKVARWESPLKVRGSETKKEMTAVTTEKTMVHVG